MCNFEAHPYIKQQSASTFKRDSFQKKIEWLFKKKKKLTKGFKQDPAKLNKMICKSFPAVFKWPWELLLKPVQESKYNTYQIHLLRDHICLQPQKEKNI